MKQNDLVLISVMVFISIVAALIISNLFFSTTGSRQQQAEVVDKITSEFAQPPTQYFNEKSVNPTKPITIGEGSNPTPFNNKPN